MLEIFFFWFTASFFSINKYLQKRQLAQIIKPQPSIYIDKCTHILYWCRYSRLPPPNSPLTDARPIAQMWFCTSIRSTYILLFSRSGFFRLPRCPSHTWARIEYPICAAGVCVCVYPHTYPHTLPLASKIPKLGQHIYPSFRWKWPPTPSHKYSHRLAELPHPCSPTLNE